MANSVRTDPLRNFKFQVMIPKVMSDGRALMLRAGFMSLSGLSIQNEVIPYREGGMNTTTHKLPGQSDFPPLQLQKGMFDGRPDKNGHAAFAWMGELFYYLQGHGGARVGNNFRSDIIIRLLDHPVTRGGPTTHTTNMPGGLTRVAWKIYNAWPSALQWSDMDAGGNGVMVEQMTLAHEGFDMWMANGPSLPDNIFL